MQSNETASVSDETLSSYLDHELEPRETASVERVLEHAATARDRLQAFEELDDLLRDWASSAEVGALERAMSGERPAAANVLESETELGSPIEQMFLAEQPHKGVADGSTPRRLLVVSAAMAAFAMVAALFAWLVVPGEREDDLSYESLIAELVEDHQNYSSMQAPTELASNDNEEVASWLSSASGLNYTPTWHESRLLGASRCTVQNTPVAATFLEDDVGRISVFAVESDRISGDFDAPFGGFPGDCCEVSSVASICVWRAGGWLFVSVANRSELAHRESLMAAIEPTALESREPRWK